MAYGNYAPFYRGGYFNPMQMPENQFSQPYQTPPMPQQTSDLIWVLNENEATSYPVSPNTTVTMWDKNQDTVYIKSVNAQGVPSMEILDYTRRTAEKTQPIGEYVKKDEFKALQEQFAELSTRIEALTQEGKK